MYTVLDVMRSRLELNNVMKPLVRNLKLVVCMDLGEAKNKD